MILFQNDALPFRVAVTKGVRIFAPVMSTKNLARTAIEGGRCGYYQSEVRAQKRSERAALRTYLRDPDEARAAPIRKPVYKCFSDKLSPVERYLDSQAGRPWNNVRSELFQRFDTRTTPGRHVLFDHVLRDVEEYRTWGRERFRVDDHGILRIGDRTRDRRPRPEPFDRRAVERFLGARQIRRHGERFVWLAPMGGKRVNVHALVGHDGVAYVARDENGQPIRDWNIRTARWEYRRPPVLWLPRGLLSRAEEAFVRALPEHAIAMLVR